MVDPNEPLQPATWVPPPALPSIEPEPEPVRVPWRWWEVLVIILIVFVTAGIVSAVIVSIMGGPISDRALDAIRRADPARAIRIEHHEDLVKAVGVVAFEAVIGLVTFAWVRLRHKAKASALGFRRDTIRGDLGAGFLWGIIGWALSTLVVGGIVVRIIESINNHPVKEPDQLQLANPSGLVLAITGVGVILLAPLCEELFFRGFAFQAFRRSAVLPVAGVASAALFMLAHVPTYIIFPSIFTLGLVLAVLFEKRRSILPGMIAHAVFNTIGFAAYLSTLHK